MEVAEPRRGEGSRLTPREPPLLVQPGQLVENGVRSLDVLHPLGGVRGDPPQTPPHGGAGTLRLQRVHQVSGTGAELEHPGLAVHDREAPLGGQQRRGMDGVEAVEVQLVPAAATVGMGEHRLSDVGAVGLTGADRVVLHEDAALGFTCGAEMHPAHGERAEAPDAAGQQCGGTRRAVTLDHEVLVRHRIGELLQPQLGPVPAREGRNVRCGRFDGAPGVAGECPVRRGQDAHREPAAAADYH